MRSTITFGGRNLADFGLFISGEGTYGAPMRSVTEEVVPGRNGTLIIDNGRYENLEVTYPAYIAKNFAENIAGLRSYLLSIKGYARLEDSYHPDVYCLATLSEGIEVETKGRYNTSGQFDLVFNRKPQRFLKRGEYNVSFTSSGTIFNQELFPSKPLIRIYGNGKVTVNSVEMTWSGSSSYVDIDCDVQDCYYMGSNMNSKVALNGYNFPELVPGVNTITLGAGVTNVQITPRWWRL